MSGTDDVPPVEEPRSIILAVISAKNDLANQIVLNMAKKADPAGQRTMGKLIPLSARCSISERIQILSALK